MTKLFSVKSLAFAGAAAFALTLAAAPQVDAAEAGTKGMAFGQREVYEKITQEEYNKLDAKGKENAWQIGEDKDGKPIYQVLKGYKDAYDAYDATVVVSKSAVTITNGKLDYYYSSVKTGEPKKWNVVSTTSYWIDRDLGNVTFYVPVQEFAKGKQANIYIAADADGVFKVGPIECKAAPKLKVAMNNLTSGPSITVKNGSSDLNSGSIWFNSQYGGFGGEVDVADLADGLDEEFMSSLQSVADFGGATLMVTYESDDDMTPSATGKLKISATPKAPKISLKLTKFSLKLKDTIAYRVMEKDAETTITKEEYKELSKDEQALYKEAGEDYELKWNDGSQMSDLKALFGTHTSEPISKEFVLDDDMVIQAKTKAKGKKTDSRITTITVYKSAATPSAIDGNVVITQKAETKKDKTTTSASIKFDTKGLELSQSSAVSSGAVVTLQYLEKNGKKWVDVKANKPEITFKAGKIPEEIYVRVKAVDYKAAKGDVKASYYEAPGHIMTIKLDQNEPEKLSTFTTTSTSIYHTLDELKAIKEAEKK